MALAERVLSGAEIQTLEAAFSGGYWAVFGEDRRKVLNILERLVGT